MAFVGDRLVRFADENPDRAALTCGPVCLSRGDLLRSVRQLERALRDLSDRGDRVVLRLKDPVALLLCFFACARTGRVAVVMDPDWPNAQTETVLREVAPGHVITDADFPDLAASDIEPRAKEVEECVPPAGNDLFYAGFTSGSSGMPKGYVRSHASWLESFVLSGRVFGIEPESRIVIPGQLSHSLHLYGAVYGLASGQEVVLQSRFDPRSVLAALVGADVGAVLYATPTQLLLLAEAASRVGPVETVRQVLASGAKWQDADHERLKQAFPNAQLFEFYGASETSFITIAALGQGVPAGSVGRAASGVRIAVGAPDDPAPNGQSGAIWVKSDLLFSGYLCGGSSETRWQDGWLTVGDQGYLDEDGFLFLTGRGNRMVVTSGLNVYPEEVEAALGAHPAVTLAVVVGLPDPLRGERLEAVVQLTEPLDAADTVLMAHCRACLGTGKVPRKFHFRRELPLTAGGKPDIQLIERELLADGGIGG